MRALVKRAGAVGLREVAPPALEAAHDVLVRVAAAGLCRTDVAVAEGRLPSREPIILGHELAGVVAQVGAGALGFAPGDRVTVHPLLPSGEMLGVDRDGAFATLLRVPAAALHRLPAGLSLLHGAYAEPVAASLAVLRAGLARGGRGLIYGDGRIALLTQRVLAASGFGQVPLSDSAEPLSESAFDWIIETQATTASLAEMLRALKPGGTLVLKSRPAAPAALDVALAVRKELQLRAVAYAPFADALALLAGGALRVDDLLAPAVPLADWEQAFAAERRSESRKQLLLIDPELS